MILVVEEIKMKRVLVSDDMGSDSDSGSDVDLSGGITRDFWVKRGPGTSSEDSDDEEALERKKELREKAKQKEKEKQRRRAERKRLEMERQRKLQGQSTKQEIEYTPEIVMERLRALLAKFGRSSTDRRQMINQLKQLATKATDPAALLKVKTTLVSTLFQGSLGGSDYMPIDSWQSCYACLVDIVTFLRSNDKVRLSEDERVETFEDTEVTG